MPLSRQGSCESMMKGTAPVRSKSKVVLSSRDKTSFEWTLRVYSMVRAFHGLLVRPMCMYVTHTRPC